MIGEHLKCRNQGSGAVFDAEGNTYFVRVRLLLNLFAAPDQEEAGEVGGIVFDAGLQDNAIVGASSLLAGDGGDACVAETHYVFDRARRVVKRAWRHHWMGCEEAAALGQGDGMGENLANVLQFAARNRDE